MWDLLFTFGIVVLGLSLWDFLSKQTGPGLHRWSFNGKNIASIVSIISV